MVKFEEARPSSLLCINPSWRTWDQNVVAAIQRIFSDLWNLQVMKRWTVRKSQVDVFDFLVLLWSTVRTQMIFSSLSLKPNKKRVASMHILSCWSKFLAHQCCHLSSSLECPISIFFCLKSHCILQYFVLSTGYCISLCLYLCSLMFVWWEPTPGGSVLFLFAEFMWWRRCMLPYHSAAMVYFATEGREPSQSTSCFRLTTFTHTHGRGFPGNSSGSLVSPGLVGKQKVMEVIGEALHHFQFWCIAVFGFIAEPEPEPETTFYLTWTCNAAEKIGRLIYSTMDRK